MVSVAPTDSKEPKDLRYRRQHFPDAERLVFDTSKKGFVPLPIIMRKLLRHLSTPEFRVLAYLHMRVSKYGICYPTQEEIAYELGLQGNKNLTPHMRKLENKKLISTKLAMGKRFYLVHDPRHGIQHLVDTNKIGAPELEEINQLLDDLGRERIQKRPAEPPLAAPTGNIAQAIEAAVQLVGIQVNP